MRKSKRKRTERQNKMDQEMISQTTENEETDETSECEAADISAEEAEADETSRRPSAEPGVLYIVATPIGNSRDMSPRGKAILEDYDMIKNAALEEKKYDDIRKTGRKERRGDSTGKKARRTHLRA